MSLQLVGTQQTVTAAIDNFSAAYHQDFAHVRAVAGPLFLNPTHVPSHAQRTFLATSTYAALRNWAAGRRAAPAVQPVAAIANLLGNPGLHADLCRLAGIQLSALSQGPAGRAAAGLQLAQIDATLIRVVQRLAAGMFVDCTNVTYPMKALLLMTGFMPAFDSQVRQGALDAGFRGTKSNQFLLPQTSTDTSAMKITRLPYYLGQCWNQNQVVFSAAIAASTQPQLVAEPGRVFDVLLFMQGKNSNIYRTLQLPAAERNSWYRIA